MCSVLEDEMCIRMFLFKVLEGKIVAESDLQSMRILGYLLWCTERGSATGCLEPFVRLNVDLLNGYLRFGCFQARRCLWAYFGSRVHGFEPRGHSALARQSPGVLQLTVVGNVCCYGDVGVTMTKEHFNNDLMVVESGGKADYGKCGFVVYFSIP